MRTSEFDDFMEVVRTSELDHMVEEKRGVYVRTNSLAAALAGSKALLRCY